MSSVRTDDDTSFTVGFRSRGEITSPSRGRMRYVPTVVTKQRDRDDRALPNLLLNQILLI